MASFSTSTAVLLLLLLALSLSNALLFSNHRRERVVRKYFEGIARQDPTLIRSCFHDYAVVRDVCALHEMSVRNSPGRTVPSHALVESCMMFVQAHPDTKVDFFYVSTPACSSVLVCVLWLARSLEVRHFPFLTHSFFLHKPRAPSLVASRTTSLHIGTRLALGRA